MQTFNMQRRKTCKHSNGAKPANIRKAQKMQTFKIAKNANIQSRKTCKHAKAQNLQTFKVVKDANLQSRKRCKQTNHSNMPQNLQTFKVANANIRKHSKS